MITANFGENYWLLDNISIKLLNSTPKKAPPREFSKTINDWKKTHVQTKRTTVHKSTLSTELKMWSSVGRCFLFCRPEDRKRRGERKAKKLRCFALCGRVVVSYSWSIKSSLQTKSCVQTEVTVAKCYTPPSMKRSGRFLLVFYLHFKFVVNLR